MTTWLVQMEARAISAEVEVEADSEYEALLQARAQGFERDDWFELTDFVARTAEELQS